MDKRFDPITEQDIQKQRQADQSSEIEKELQRQKDADEAFLLNAQTFAGKIKAETDPKQKELLELTLKIAEAIKAENGLALVVGGYARDEALRRFGYNLSPKDIDIEVYGLKFDELKKVLSRFGQPEVVGESFGVIKLRGLDISIPRRDSKTGQGHKGFRIEGDPDMLIEEAARRRDFTINAFGLDPLTGEIVDKFNGLEDMKNKVLRATDPNTFIEDPLRVLRAMQFSGRFAFQVDPETTALCRTLDLSELSKERIGEEWVKLLTKSAQPSIGLETARKLGVIEKLHPELQTLIGVPQDPEWHPEGDVWVHTNMVIDAAAEIARRNNLDDQEKLVVVLAALCHDLGKPDTTTLSEKTGRFVAHNHSEAGLEPTKSFLNILKTPNELASKILNLVNEHLFPAQNKNASDSAIRRLALRLAPATIEELVMVSEADQRGRATPRHGFPEGEELIKKAKELSLEKSRPTKIVNGRDLIPLGVEPGPKMGKILEQLFEAQLDGQFKNLEEGLEYFKKSFLITLSSPE